ncbi:MAG: helix-turn-helix transcriptional regulator [Clostridia bacterium]|nr:helix-turn-helix transcriptional regulator [Clostridia bacterium]
MKDEKLLKEIGERIFERRKYLKLTQEDVAEKMNVSIQMISNLELGKKAIRPENLVKISSVLKISTDYILTGEEVDLQNNPVTVKLSQLSEEHLAMVDNIVDLCLSTTNK